MYFGIYQALAEDERRVGLFRSFPADFFDLVIVDECHRGSARDESAWRVVLDYFQPAVQLGMTATPLREETRDTHLYFGDPIYQYSLRQGIDDGFLAPYRVHRVVTEWDAAGWRPSKDELDRYGRSIPDDEYHTKDFERIVALRARTETIARHLTQFLKRTDRFAKTGPTREVWYYEHSLPEGRKNYTKTAPLQFEEFAACRAWWTHREENERAWTVPVAELLANNCNLDRKNPRAKEDIAHLPPEQIVASILEKEQRIAEIMGEIQKLLAEGSDS